MTIDSDKKVLVAVSGGSDSMCLLNLLAEMGIDIIVAHFNHRMRDNSTDDAVFVQKYCEEHDILYCIGEADGNLRSEDDARKARYAFLEECADDFGCDYIATAHNKNDNAETVLLNLTRGSGATGLCGIPEMRGRIIRPILDMTKAEILDYDRSHGIPFVEDPTNVTDDYHRNLIRHQVLPVLESINPNVVDAIFRCSKLLKEDDDYLNSLSENINPLTAPRPLASRFIRHNCPTGLSYDQMETVLNLGDGYKEVDLPGMKIVKEQGRLIFTPEAPSYVVSMEEIIVHNELINQLINCDSIKGEVRVSVRQPGDKFRVAGRNCTKTLKKLYLEAKLTKSQRDAWPVIRDEEGILWVYKLGVAERALAAPGDKAYYIKVQEQ